LRAGLLRAVYHGENGLRTLQELARNYLTISKDQARVMSRLKALYRSWGIPCSGRQVYTPRHRGQWRSRIAHPGVRRRAELFYQQMDGLSAVRHTVRGELLAESRKREGVKILRQIPLSGKLVSNCALSLTLKRIETKKEQCLLSRHNTAQSYSLLMLSPLSPFAVAGILGPVERPRRAFLFETAHS
jgi:hypothetical protein